MAELVIALDYPDADQALGMARKLRGVAPWVKVGLELFTVAGPGVVASLASMGFAVFLDMKFFDIPNTVAGAVRAAVGSGASMLNIHLLGGERMIDAAVEARDAACGGGCPRPYLLGVTVLTSMAAADLAGVVGAVDGAGAAAAVNLADTAVRLARMGWQRGMDGVVCSGYEVGGIKKSCGDDYLCLTPGIRPAEATGGDDQRRVMTPVDAVRAGADFLVVGRPVTRAADPEAVARGIVADMAARP
ncbi:MAG: orotidine-5'-phosphate decarboxylase [Desulfovibrionaceae bacterium]